MNFSAPFEDVAVGDAFTSRGRTVTEADVVAFAALTGDWHPQHADAEWARGSVFGARVAHGMLVVSYAVGLVPLDPERVVALRRMRNVTFKAPTHIGDTIRLRGRITNLAPIDSELGIVTCAWTIVNQSDRTLVRANVEVIWRFGEPAPTPAEPELAPTAVPL